MDHSVSTLLNILIGLVSGTPIAFGMALMLSPHERHWRAASRLIIGGLLATCGYPVLWSWDSPQSIAKVIILGALWGAFAGAAAYAILLWFRNESSHRNVKSDEPEA